MTLCRQWAWKPDDAMKWLKECIQTLVQVAGGDGNLLFNVGPMPDGRIEPRQAERLHEMGAWLRQNGESVYGTRGGPFKPSSIGVSTCKDQRIYVHLLNCPAGEFTLPPIPRRITGHAILGSGHAELEQTAAGIRVAVPAASRGEIDTILVLELDGPATTIEPVAWHIPSGSLAYGRPTTASNVFRGRSEYAADKAVDDDDRTRWATDAGTQQAWLEVDLGKPAAVSRARIREAIEYGQRIQQFQIEYEAGGQWKVAHRGEAVGADHLARFPAVTARRFRLHILAATEGPTIWEFHLYGAGD